MSVKEGSPVNIVEYNEPPLDYMIEKTSSRLSENSFDPLNQEQDETPQPTFIPTLQPDSEDMEEQGSADPLEHYYKNVFHPEVTALCQKTWNHFRDLHQRGLISDKDAIVFDVDDTLLSTSPTIRREWTRRGVHIPPRFYPPIEPVRDLYLALRRLGLKTLILTGRYPTVKTWTTLNLRWVGIERWDEMDTRGWNELTLPAQVFKTRRRKEWAKNYRIVGNVGDQDSDLDGDDQCGHKVKIPNPMYKVI